MSDLQIHPVYSHDADGTVIGVAWAYLTDFTRDGQPAHDPGGVRLTLSDEDGIKCAIVEPEDAVEIGSAIITAAQMAIAARDVVPAEWTEGPV